MTVKVTTAGESHGPALTVILEGLPAGVEVSAAAIERELARRQGGYGRGERMRIEEDRAVVVSGLRDGLTTGFPISMVIPNRDHVAWSGLLRPFATAGPGMEPGLPAAEGVPGSAARSVPRPGHADFAGALKLGLTDVRNVMERASARGTATLVAAGAVCRELLRALEIEVWGWVWKIGPIETVVVPEGPGQVEPSEVRCPDPKAAEGMKAAIDQARAGGTTLGGAFTVVVEGLPAGLGSCANWERRLDGLVAQALMSIPSVKAVALGEGIRCAGMEGHLAQDPILPGDHGRWSRPSNRAGGVEGGISNGSPLLATAWAKPIPTTRKAQASVDLTSWQEAESTYERSDTCVVPAALVIGEAMLAIVLAGAVVETCGSDRMDRVRDVFGTLVGAS